jgi:hypothetical protein
MEGDIMWKNQKKAHPSDQELLLFSDGELSSRATERIRKHLLECWHCRTRHARIQATITEFMEVYRNSARPLPSGDDARNLLKARMAESNSRAGHDGWRWLFSARYGQSIAAVVLALAAAVLIFQHYEIGSRSTKYAALLPDPKLTPGSARTTAIGDICSMDHDEVIRPVSASLQRRVFEEYGLGEAQSANFEIDYLITPGLGGADDIRNLWPQPHNAKWNSYVKDQLEERLHSLVCGGEVNLSVAQRDIAKNWISAYQKYFHTEEPLPSKSFFIPMKPDAIRAVYSDGQRDSQILNSL